MRSDQLIPNGRSYWIAVIAALFVMGLLILSISLSATIEGKHLKFDTSFLLGAATYESEQNLDIEQVKLLAAAQWRPLLEENLGLSDRPYWFRIQPEPLEQNSQYLLEINYGLLDHVEMWVFNHYPQRPDDMAVTFSVGDAQAFQRRPIQYEQFLFPITAYSKDLTIYLRVQSAGPIKVPMRFWQESDFIEYSGSYTLFMGLFFGYMIAMALFTLFIFVSTRNQTFAVYTAYVISLALVVATLHGLGFRYLWSENTWFQERAMAFFACSTMILIIMFTIQVLDLKNTAKYAERWLNMVKWSFVFLLAMVFVLPYALMLKSILILIALISPLILASSLILAFKGQLIARYFTAAWAALLIAVTGLTVENLGWFELPMDSSYLIMVGAIAETLFLALALAMSFSNQYKVASEARAQALENEQQAIAAKDELLQLQEESKQALEYSVEERTLELEIAMRELSDANHELERLSAIDALTGLMNRRYFDKRLLAEARRSRREQRYLSLAMLDIDFFKKVNDTHGHVAGDACLKSFAQTLQTHIQRPSDIICRYGGEEFVVILPGTEIDGAATLMEKVRQAVEDSVTEFDGKTLKMTVSIGLTARIMSNDDEQAQILACADKLLYEAKSSGRNKVIAKIS
ncbi:diguanylate cyclase [Glaciecola sp. SC05]|uniref:sensor domain-containing diguanylate cyclase n=1 Tax=Glaciecola sp. SC05 TaxID=1987355 RepID=UPI0035280D66